MDLSKLDIPEVAEKIIKRVLETEIVIVPDKIEESLQQAVLSIAITTIHSIRDHYGRLHNAYTETVNTNDDEPVLIGEVRLCLYEIYGAFQQAIWELDDKED